MGCAHAKSSNVVAILPNNHIGPPTNKGSHEGEAGETPERRAIDEAAKNRARSILLAPQAPALDPALVIDTIPSSEIASNSPFSKSQEGEILPKHRNHIEPVTARNTHPSRPSSLEPGLAEPSIAQTVIEFVDNYAQQLINSTIDELAHPVWAWVFQERIV